MAGPTLATRSYVLTFAALLALTLSTVLIGYVDLGWGSIIVAVAIAACKAALIAAFFMHALLEKRIVWLVVAGALVWFLILASLTLGDYITRGWLVPGR